MKFRTIKNSKTRKNVSRKFEKSDKLKNRKFEKSIQKSKNRRIEVLKRKIEIWIIEKSKNR